MSSLVLVRHAQASFFEVDYDQLAPAGVEQARRLGAHWATLGLRFDEVYTGPRVRHRHTAETVGAALERAGLSWPTEVVLDQFDEHAVDRLLHGALTELRRGDRGLAPLAEAYQHAESRPDRQRTFQLLFEAVARRWCEGACEFPNVETWPAFQARVQSGLDRILAGDQRGRRVAVFTSVGPISVALQRALGCADQKAIELGWRLRNASLTEFVFTRDRITLDSFNSVAHLDDPALWTYR
ncbi:MAG TPA: histidine phosphatase family protein [Isosphaeraceae bacterium]|jgi:broad specificity phosphatase PhoE|nr:histidine phosphatase family protein [Isosphaeraceae bacterium]